MCLRMVQKCVKLENVANDLVIIKKRKNVLS